LLFVARTSLATLENIGSDSEAAATLKISEKLVRRTRVQESRKRERGEREEYRERRE